MHGMHTSCAKEVNPSADFYNTRSLIPVYSRCYSENTDLKRARERFPEVERRQLRAEPEQYIRNVSSAPTVTAALPARSRPQAAESIPRRPAEGGMHVERGPLFI